MKEDHIWLADKAIDEAKEKALAPIIGVKITSAGDWRDQIDDFGRTRVTHKILDTLRRHLPFSGDEGMGELDKIALRFEQKIYLAATSQEDYLRKISLKMLTMDTESIEPVESYLRFMLNPQDRDPQSSPSQVQNQTETIRAESQG